MAGGRTVGTIKSKESDGSNAKDAKKAIDQAQHQPDDGGEQLLDHDYEGASETNQIEIQVVIWIGVSSGRVTIELTIANVHWPGRN